MTHHQLPGVETDETHGDLPTSGARATTDRGTLVLLRHGRTQWNDESRFTGWADPSLSELGTREAAWAGEVIASCGVRVSVVIASFASRALQTATFAMPVTSAPDRRRDWRLNERHFGLLQGLDRSAAIDRYGKASVRQWRRDRDAVPPAIPKDDARHPHHDPRYAGVAPAELPGAESKADHERRIRACWLDTIDPLLVNGVAVLVVAHCHSLRALARLAATRDVDESPTLFAATGSVAIVTGSGALRELPTLEVPSAEAPRGRTAANRVQ